MKKFVLFLGIVVVSQSSLAGTVSKIDRKTGRMLIDLTDDEMKVVTKGKTIELTPADKNISAVKATVSKISAKQKFAITKIEDGKVVLKPKTEVSVKVLDVAASTAETPAPSPSVAVAPAVVAQPEPVAPVEKPTTKKPKQKSAPASVAEEAPMEDEAPAHGSMGLSGYPLRYGAGLGYGFYIDTLKGPSLNFMVHTPTRWQLGIMYAMASSVDSS